MIVTTKKNFNMNIEIASFNEKISLAKLEVTKAQERVAELVFQKSRYTIEMLKIMAKQNTINGNAHESV